MPTTQKYSVKSYSIIKDTKCPFGMLERSYSNRTYRFGFNGKENDNEILGNGRWQDYGERLYRPDLIRFFTPDPLIIYQKKYPELSSYQFASNRPIDGIDLDGLEHQSYVVKLNDKGKVVNVVETSRFIFDVGKKGWGTQYKFYDDNNKFLFELFIPSEPPLIWTGKNRGFYLYGKKLAGNGEYEGEEGFKNGGWKILLSSGSLVLGVGEFMAAEKAVETAWATGSILLATNDIISSDGKTLVENILGPEYNAKIKFSLAALSFIYSIKAIGEMIKDGVNVADAVSSIMNMYGGVDNFIGAMEAYQKEVKQEMESKKELNNATKRKKTSKSNKTKGKGK